MNFSLNNNSSMSLDYFVVNHRKGPRINQSGDESIVTHDSLGPQLDKGVTNPVKPSSKRGGKKAKSSRTSTSKSSTSTSLSLGTALGKLNDSFLNDSAGSLNFYLDSAPDELTCMTTDSREIAVMSGAPLKSKTRSRRRPQKV